MKDTKAKITTLAKNKQCTNNTDFDKMYALYNCDKTNLTAKERT